MKEVRGNLWDYYGKDGFVVMLTTNGTVKRDGCAVMGRGCALEAKKRIPGIDKQLGQLMGRGTRRFCWPLDDGRLMAFPVKHEWHQKADLALIRESAQFMTAFAKAHEKDTVYILPRPGCGNGHRTWAEVKPLLDGLPDNVWVITW